MVKYVELSPENEVIGISFLSGEVQAEHMILISEEEPVDLGWKLIDGKWVKPDPIIPEEPSLTDFEHMVTTKDLEEKINLLMIGLTDIYEAVLKGSAF